MVLHEKKVESEKGTPKFVYIEVPIHRGGVTKDQNGKIAIFAIFFASRFARKNLKLNYGGRESSGTSPGP